MPPFRQSLEGVKDDGTLVGKGGRTQKLGAGATRRLASRTTDTAVSKPVERPPAEAAPRPVPAWKQLADKGVSGQGSAAANRAKLAGFQVGPPPPGYGTMMTDGAPPPGGPAAGVSGASPEILQRIEQLAAERGLGGAPGPVGAGPGIATLEARLTPDQIPPAVRDAMAAAPPGAGLPPPATPRGIPGFQVPPGFASTLPANLEAGGGPGPGPAPGGMTKPLLGARPPMPPGGTAAGPYDGLANVAAGMRRRNSMAGLEA